MTKICIWGAWYESKNAGDQAILMTIGQLLAREIPDLELVVFSNRPSFTENYMKSIFTIRALSLKQNLFAILLELLTCDLFIIGGGTPFYNSLRHMLAMLVFVLAARIGNHPVMTYAVSARPIKSKLVRLIARLSLCLINCVTVREPNAIRLLTGLGAHGPVRLYVDPAITLQPRTSDILDNILGHAGLQETPKPLIGICPHFFSSDHPYTLDHYEKFSSELVHNYHNVLAKAADWLSKQGTVIFIPFNTEYPDNDLDAIQMITGLMKTDSNFHVISRQFGPDVISALLNRCELVLAVRLHSAVLSSSVCTPVVAVSYGPKVAGYMNRIGLGNNSIELAELTYTALIDLLNETWSHRQSIKRTLIKVVPELQELAMQNAQVASMLCGMSSIKI